MKLNLINSVEGCHLKSNYITHLTLSDLALMKEGKVVSDSVLRQMSKITIDNLSDIFQFKNIKRLNEIIDNEIPFQLTDYKQFNNKYIYKYLSKDSLRYIEKGLFQLGSLDYYKKMENISARDELEGLSFIYTELNNRSIYSCISAGRNFRIFCCTEQSNDLPSNYHRNTFGNILLKIEAEPFIKIISEKIGAYAIHSYKVNYSNSKLLRSKLDINIEPTQISNFNSVEMQKYFHYLINQCNIPSIFTKSRYFSNENELRIAFEIPFDADINIPYRFESKDLLEYIEIIEI